METILTREFRAIMLIENLVQEGDATVALVLELEASGKPKQFTLVYEQEGSWHNFPNYWEGGKLQQWMVDAVNEAAQKAERAVPGSEDCMADWLDWADDAEETLQEEADSDEDEG